MSKWKEIPRLFKGSKEHPITNNEDLLNAMIGRKDTIIYINRKFELNERTLFEIDIRNIEIKYVGDKENDNNRE